MNSVSVFLFSGVLFIFRSNSLAFAQSIDGSVIRNRPKSRLRSRASRDHSSRSAASARGDVANPASTGFRSCKDHAAACRPNMRRAASGRFTWRDFALSNLHLPICI
jgi:hypothetical protein